MSIVRHRLLVFCASIGLVAGTTVGSRADEGSKENPTKKEESVMVQDGKQVGIEYTLTLDDGTQVDSNVGGEPLVFQQGAHQILPALEEALAGLKVGDTKEVALTAEQGYGPVREEGFQEVDAGMIPENARVEGTMLVADDGAGNKRPVRVHEIKGDKIVVDLNHPLAGKALTFAVRVMAIH
jgi:FKBP-type peptidyl-prolyl cis-trans isomerase 2